MEENKVKKKRRRGRDVEVEVNVESESKRRKHAVSSLAAGSCPSFPRTVLLSDIVRQRNAYIL